RTRRDQRVARTDDEYPRTGRRTREAARRADPRATGAAVGAPRGAETEIRTGRGETDERGGFHVGRGTETTRRRVLGRGHRSAARRRGVLRPDAAGQAGAARRLHPGTVGGVDRVRRTGPGRRLPPVDPGNGGTAGRPAGDVTAVRPTPCRRPSP